MSVAFTITAGALAGGAFQRPASSGADSHWYLWCSQPRVWPEARQFALAVGGDLASLETSDERAWIYAQPGRPSGYLAGACQSSAADAPAEGWSWLTGVAIAAGDMSADDCGADGKEEHRQDYLEVAGNLLGDIHPGGPNLCGSDSGQRPFLIEWSADCNADGKVDYGQIRRGELADFNGNNIPDCCERGEPCVVDNFPVEWKKSEGGNGHWYRGRPSSSDRSADSWRIEAQGRGAHLVTIVTQQESDWLDVLVDQDSLWPSSYVGPIIGMRVDDGGCAAGCWDTGEPLSWTNWWPGNPDVTDTDRSVCLFDRSSRKWQNYPEGGGDFGNLAKPRSTIFEWSADCNADGKVDLGQILRGDLLDRDSNGVPDTCQCATNPALAICCTSDLDLDGEIGASDISLLLLTFGEPRWAAPAFDLDGDGEIGGGDISIILLDVGPCS